MKKLVILTIIYCCLINGIHSQAWVENLSDFKKFSEMSLEDLESNLSTSGWYSTGYPVQERDGATTIKKYYFNSSFEYKVQTIQRTEFSNRSAGTKTGMTSLLMNYVTLLEKIEKDLPDQGFELKEETYNELIYEKGDYLIVITKEVTQDGYFRIDIYDYSSK